MAESIVEPNEETLTEIACSFNIACGVAERVGSSDQRWVVDTGAV